MNYLLTTKFRWLPAAIAIGLASSGPVTAVSLPEAVEAAMNRHPDRQLASAERHLAGAMRHKAAQVLAADPSVSLKYETDALGSGRGFREWEGGVDLPLWWPGQPAAYRREADRTLDAADARGRAQRLAVAGEVRERIWRLELARSERNLAQSALQVAQRLAGDVERRLEAGELPRSDQVLAQERLLTREDALEQASVRLTEAQRLFALYTGLEALESSHGEQAAPKQEQAQEQNQELAANHPALMLPEAAVARARAHRDRIQGERRSGPNLWLGARSEKVGAGADYESFVAMQISLPLGSAAHAGTSIAQAEAELTEALAARDRTLHELEAALSSAVLELERTRGAEQRSRRREALAEESLKLNRRAFELGETDLVRLLQAQDSAIAARYAAKTRSIEHARAIARLNQALGVVPQ